MSDSDIANATGTSPEAVLQRADTHPPARPKRGDQEDRRCSLAGEMVRGRRVECAALAAGDADWCFGCRSYVCEEHEAVVGGAHGSHRPEAHLA